MTLPDGYGKKRFLAYEDGVFWGVWDSMNKRWHKRDLTKKEAHALAALLSNRHWRRNK